MFAVANAVEAGTSYVHKFPHKYDRKGKSYCPTKRYGTYIDMKIDDIEEGQLKYTRVDEARDEQRKEKHKEYALPKGIFR